MARTRKNKSGGARRHKEDAKAQQQKAATPAQAATDSPQDGLRPAKRARLEKRIGARVLSTPDNASHGAVQESGKRRDTKARIEEMLDTSAVPTRPKSRRKPTRPAKPPPASLHYPSPQTTNPIEQVERSSLRTDFISSLSKTHDVISLSIISSSSIQKKVSRVLSHLSSPSTAKKPLLAVLTAKAGVASKAITVTEISKREIGKDGGVWFQYSGVEGVLCQRAPRERGTTGRGDKTDGDDGGGVKAVVSEDPAEVAAEAAQEKADRGKDAEEDEDEDAFETMRKPPTTNQEAQERPSIVEGELRTKVRAVPVLTIYLSRTQVGELKKEYGCPWATESKQTLENDPSDSGSQLPHLFASS